MRQFLFILCLGMLLATPAFMQPDTSEEPAIEKGDTIELYIYDQQGNDLLMTPLIQVNGIYQQNPHVITVAADGRIYVANLGAINIDGKKATEVEDIIKKQYNKAIKLRDVAVLLKTEKNANIYILGEINRPGLYKLNKAKPEENRLFNIIGMAGGFTEKADLETIKITDRAGQSRFINVQNILRFQSTTQNVGITDGDTVIVGQAIGKVYVVGEVAKPGAYPYTIGASYGDYIANAGGVTLASARENIGIMRKEADGTHVERVALDQYYKETRPLAIRSGDFIVVSRHWYADVKENLGWLLSITQNTLYTWDILHK